MGIEQLSTIWPEWSVVGQIGEGSFGKVYKVVRNEHGITDHAAIKVITIPRSDAEISSLKADGYDETSALSYFESVVMDCVNEIKLMVSMKGTANIVNVEDYKVVEKAGEAGWDIYIRMELLTSFGDYTADRKLSEPEVIKLGQDMCSALEICSRKNIIHRDIKPENVFVSPFGDFKLGDFGIARELEKTGGSMSMTSVGTYNYIAPEITKAKKYDSTVDIYSLGLLLYKQLNNNRLPFIDPYADQITYQVRKGAVDRRLSGEAFPFPVNASPGMGHVVLKACSYDPSMRFRTATELKQALEDVKNGVYAIKQGDANKPKKPLNDPDGFGEKRFKFKKSATILVGILCICLIALALILYSPLGFPNDDSSPPYPSGTTAPPSQGQTTPAVTPPPVNEPDPTPEDLASGQQEKNKRLYLLDTTNLIDIFPSLSNDERNALHIFFSNFAETYFVEFDIDDYDINSLIYFAIWHNYKNFWQRFSYSTHENSYYISSQHIDRIVERFFDIRNIDHDGYVAPHGYSFYYDGDYYVELANGEPTSFAQVTGLYERDDGALVALFDVYFFDEYNVPSDVWVPNFTFRDFYQDKENWPDRYKPHMIYQYSAKSLIIPFNFNGRETYRLLILEMQSDR